jgi:hypothetical protein
VVTRNRQHSHLAADGIHQVAGSIVRLRQQPLSGMGGGLDTVDAGPASA